MTSPFLIEGNKLSALKNKKKREHDIFLKYKAKREKKQKGNIIQFSWSIVIENDISEMWSLWKRFTLI